MDVFVGPLERSFAWLLDSETVLSSSRERKQFFLRVNGPSATACERVSGCEYGKPGIPPATSASLDSSPDEFAHSDR